MGTNGTLLLSPVKRLVRGCSGPCVNAVPVGEWVAMGRGRRPGAWGLGVGMGLSKIPRALFVALQMRTTRATGPGDDAETPCAVRIQPAFVRVEERDRRV